MSVLDDICFQMHGQSEGADMKLIEVKSTCVWILHGSVIIANQLAILGGLPSTVLILHLINTACANLHVYSMHVSCTTSVFMAALWALGMLRGNATQ